LFLTVPKSKPSQTKLILYGHAMVQAVSCWLLTVEAWVTPMWNLWWTKWQWDRFFSEFVGSHLSISFHRISPYSYTICGITNRPVGGHTSQT
jgi:hypothetical protein